MTVRTEMREAEAARVFAERVEAANHRHRIKVAAAQQREQRLADSVIARLDESYSLLEGLYSGGHRISDLDLPRVLKAVEDLYVLATSSHPDLAAKRNLSRYASAVLDYAAGLRDFLDPKQPYRLSVNPRVADSGWEPYFYLAPDPSLYSAKLVLTGGLCDLSAAGQAALFKKVFQVDWAVEVADTRLNEATIAAVTAARDEADLRVRDLSFRNVSGVDPAALMPLVRPQLTRGPAAAASSAELVTGHMRVDVKRWLHCVSWVATAKNPILCIFDFDHSEASRAAVAAVADAFPVEEGPVNLFVMNGRFFIPDVPAGVRQLTLDRVTLSASDARPFSDFVSAHPGIPVSLRSLVHPPAFPLATILRETVVPAVGEFYLHDTSALSPAELMAVVEQTRDVLRIKKIALSGITGCSQAEVDRMTVILERVRYRNRNLSDFEAIAADIRDFMVTAGSLVLPADLERLEQVLRDAKTLNKHFWPGFDHAAVISAVEGVVRQFSESARNFREQEILNQVAMVYAFVTKAGLSVPPALAVLDVWQRYTDPPNIEPMGHLLSRLDAAVTVMLRPEEAGTDSAPAAAASGAGDRETVAVDPALARMLLQMVSRVVQHAFKVAMRDSSRFEKRLNKQQQKDFTQLRQLFRASTSFAERVKSFNALGSIVHDTYTDPLFPGLRDLADRLVTLFPDQAAAMDRRVSKVGPVSGKVASAPAPSAPAASAPAPSAPAASAPAPSAPAAANMDASGDSLAFWAAQLPAAPTHTFEVPAIDPRELML